MQTVTEWFRELEGWRRECCAHCGGYGMVSDYGWDSRDFYGPEECSRCAGTGSYWRTPRRRYVLYPGGPFC